jgi:hypothetical protein
MSCGRETSLARLPHGRGRSVAFASSRSCPRNPQTIRTGIHFSRDGFAAHPRTFAVHAVNTPEGVAQIAKRRRPRHPKRMEAGSPSRFGERPSLVVVPDLSTFDSVARRRRRGHHAAHENLRDHRFASRVLFSRGRLRRQGHRVRGRWRRVVRELVEQRVFERLVFEHVVRYQRLFKRWRVRRPAEHVRFVRRRPMALPWRRLPTVPSGRRQGRVVQRLPRRLLFCMREWFNALDLLQTIRGVGD